MFAPGRPAPLQPPRPTAGSAHAAVLLLPVLLLPGASAVAAPSELPEVDAAVLERLQQARRDSGAPLLARRAALDTLAGERARMIAERPARRRLAGREPIEHALERAGRRYRSALEVLDLKRGYRDPAAAFVESLRASRAKWERALDRRMDAAGLACVVADDGWVILVAVFVEDRAAPPNPHELERQAMEAVNRVRREHGLEPLEVLEELTRVARHHSEDMARQGYFAHESPQGLAPADRVRKRGLSYTKIAENIQLSRGTDDPVGVAVESWMSSPGHRRNILDADFTRTGVGVALADDETVHFTQLFLKP